MSGTEPAKSAPGGLGWRITNSQLTALSSLKVPYKGARRGSRGRGPRIDLHMPRSPPLTNPNPDRPPPDTEGIECEPVTLGIAASADGSGVDTETYHPIAADGSNPAIAGRVAARKGGMTIRNRPFLLGVHLTLGIPVPDGERIAAALRRPVWGL